MKIIFENEASEIIAEFEIPEAAKIHAVVERPGYDLAQRLVGAILAAIRKLQ